MRLFRFLLVPMMLLSGFSSGCAVNPTDIKGFNLISIEEEKQLGSKFSAEVEKQQTVIKDPDVQNYVDRVGRRLLTGVQARDFDYTFKVIKDNDVNAFAVPGGHIYVNSGLIKAADNESELAGVMAHEINHAVARHGTRQLTQQYGFALVSQLVLGQDPNLLAQLASSLFGQAGTMSYSRSMESQADYLGVQTMYRAGYNPNGMTTFLGKLETMKKSNPGSLAQFFSTHPMTSDRIQSVKRDIAQLPAKVYQEDNTELIRIKAKLR
ncbi:MAG: peptidase lipoprotein, family [Geobacteraceae bacterium]|nr:peptidase lipoprotein, family [Geobacteraceae bacterium]